MIKRRSFLKGLAAFVAVAALPKAEVEAFVAEAKQKTVIDVPDLAPGRYTFSMYVCRPGSKWVRVERDYDHDSGPLRLGLYDVIENADRISDAGIVTTGDTGRFGSTQVAFAQVERKLGGRHVFGTLSQ